MKAQRNRWWMVGTPTLLLAGMALYFFSEAHPVPAVSSGPPRTYSTEFRLTERPLAEGGAWISGRAAGLDWSDVRSTSGLVTGTDSGYQKYADSTALLTGSWATDQAVQATVHSVNQSDHFYEEVELRLRSSLTSHRATGYEINFRCSKTSNAYAEIVKWNGRLGDFTYLKRGTGARYGVADGDVVLATALGHTITAYINGVEVLRVDDHTYSGGSPGIGFYLEGTADVNTDYGFTKFSATDRPLSSTQRPSRQLHEPEE